MKPPATNWVAIVHKAGKRIDTFKLPEGANLSERLRAHLLSLHERKDYLPLLREALLDRFAAPELHQYAALDTMAHQAEESGYATIR